jgi:hypothetical protein
MAVNFLYTLCPLRNAERYNNLFQAKTSHVIDRAELYSGKRCKAKGSRRKEKEY